MTAAAPAREVDMIGALLTLPISLDTVSDNLLVKLATKPICAAARHRTGQVGSAGAVKVTILTTQQYNTSRDVERRRWLHMMHERPRSKQQRQQQCKEC
jgi:hypothetical protein